MHWVLRQSAVALFRRTKILPCSTSTFSITIPFPPVTPSLRRVIVSDSIKPMHDVKLDDMTNQADAMQVSSVGTPDSSSVGTSDSSVVTFDSSCSSISDEIPDVQVPPKKTLFNSYQALHQHLKPADVIWIAFNELYGKCHGNMYF